MSPARKSEALQTGVDEWFPPGSVLYYVGRSLLPRQRRPALARFALLRELRQLRFIIEPDVAAGKLQWWHEELARWQDGRPRHPITRSLERGADAAGSAAVRAAVDAVTGPAPATAAAGLAPEPDAVWLFALRPYIVRAPAAACQLGRAHGRCEQIADFGYLLRHGQVAIDMGAIGDELAEAIAQARADLDRAAAELAPEVSPPARVMVALDRALMTELARDPTQVIDNRVRLTPLRMAWLSWRAQRHRQFEHP